MKIHEYQAKDILERYGVAVPKGEVANTLPEAADAARLLLGSGASGVVVKARYRRASHVEYSLCLAMKLCRPR